MLNNNKIIKSIKYTQRSRLHKQANLRKCALTKLALRYVIKKTNFTKSADPRDGAMMLDGGGQKAYNGAADLELMRREAAQKEHEARMNGTYQEPMTHLDPGVYEVNSGVFPLPFFKRLGISDTLRHALAVTIHDDKPDIPDAYQLPNGQYATYFTSNPTSKYPWVGGENLPVWNGHYNQGGIFNTKKDWHLANQHILNAMVNPNYKVREAGLVLNPKEFNIDYTRVADGEDEANRVAKIWQDLYERNKYRSFGPYSYGLQIPANNCLSATAFALSNAGLSSDRYPNKIGGGGSIPKENINKYINLGITPYNTVPRNPAPPAFTGFPIRSDTRTTEDIHRVPTM